MIVAIDGPAGSGKSSTAKQVASTLGIVHLDTGAMYRAVTLHCLNEGIDFRDEAAMAAAMGNIVISFSGTPPDTRTWLNGVDVSDAIRSDEVTKNVSDYCAVACVREALVRQQRDIGISGSLVCEGRDMTTVVFPSAELKIYMTASVEERAKRRKLDFEKLGVAKTLEELIADIAERDRKDSSRANSPLMQAADAILLDTTGMTLSQQIKWIVERARPFLDR